MSSQFSTYVKERLGRPDGVAAVYKLSEQVGYGDDRDAKTQYVWVSAVPHVGSYEGPETYIFASDADGEVLDWCELSGIKGVMSHQRALAEFGFPVLGSPVTP